MKLDQKIKIVKDAMLERYPDCRHTIRILLWDDGTDLVECRHGIINGDNLQLQIVTYYNDKLSYDVKYFKKTSTMLIDEKGKKYSVIHWFPFFLLANNFL